MLKWVEQSHSSGKVLTELLKDIFPVPVLSVALFLAQSVPQHRPLALALQGEHPQEDGCR